MIHIDGFILSHMIEPIEPISEEIAKKYLPVYQPADTHRLNPDKPVTMGAFAMPELFSEAKKNQDEALKATMPAILKGWDDWAELTGRKYQPIETYKTEGAETMIITMGSMSETASEAVDIMRAKGMSVGLVKIRLWRPFPFDLFRKAVAGAKTLMVFDRCVSFGGQGGPFSSEVRAAMYGEAERPRVVNFIGGLAGRDVSPQDFEKMTEEAIKKTGDHQEDYEIYGVRG